MVPLSMTLSHTNPQFQGHRILRKRISGASVARSCLFLTPGYSLKQSLKSVTAVDSAKTFREKQQKGYRVNEP